MSQKQDLIIIGAGPIGMACGIEAEKHQLSYQIIDKGCLVNSLYHYPYGMTFFSTSEKLEIGGVPFISHNPKPTRMEALEYYRRVADHWDLKLKLYEEVLKVSGEQGAYHVKTNKGNYQSRHVIVATGFYDLPHMLGIVGEELPKVLHYYKESHPFFRQKLCVVGAANSAVDAALECYRKGAEVTMVVREPELSGSVKYWVKPDIENRIKEGSIKAYFNSQLKEIRDTHVLIESPSGELKIENNFVLAMTGYEPDYEFLGYMGVEREEKPPYRPVFDPNTMETNMAGIYLAGVICGGMETNKWFIENSRVHAELIISDMISNQNMHKA